MTSPEKYARILFAQSRGCGGIGRRARLRIWWLSVQVQVLSPAPKSRFERTCFFFWAGVGLEPISLKTHVETQEEVAAALSDLKSIMSDVQPVEKTLEEQPIVEPAPEVEPEPAPEPEPEPELKLELASEHAEPVESPKKKRSAGMKFLLTIVIVLSIILILLGAYMIVARQIPGVFDTILYTPEELQILNYKL